MYKNDIRAEGFSFFKYSKTISDKSIVNMRNKSPYLNYVRMSETTFISQIYSIVGEDLLPKTISFFCNSVKLKLIGCNLRIKCWFLFLLFRIHLNSYQISKQGGKGGFRIPGIPGILLVFPGFPLYSRDFHWIPGISIGFPGFPSDSHWISGIPIGFPRIGNPGNPPFPP